MDGQYSVNTDSYTNLEGLAKLKYLARQKSPQAVKEVAGQFEALFTQMMVKSMRDASMGGGLFESEQSKMYMDMFDKQIAIQMSAAGGIGLAKMIATQLGRVTNIDPDQETNKETNLLPKIPISIPPVNTDKKVDLQLQKYINSIPVTTKQSGANTAAVQTDQSPLDFAKSIWNQVKGVAKELNISPKAILAQVILETGWGKHIPKDKNGNSAHNLFGIKATPSWNGNKITVDTNEFHSNRLIEIQQTFRGYDSSEKSLKDYANFLQQNPRYQKVLGTGNNINKFIQEIKDSGYATDPDYGSKLHGIINGNTFKDIMKKLAS